MGPAVEKRRRTSSATRLVAAAGGERKRAWKAMKRHGGKRALPTTQIRPTQILAFGFPQLKARLFGSILKAGFRIYQNLVEFCWDSGLFIAQDFSLKINLRYKSVSRIFSFKQICRTNKSAVTNQHNIWQTKPWSSVRSSIVC
jgi:hypothetical protein